MSLQNKILKFTKISALYAYVTRFAKRGLVHTNGFKTHFYRHLLATLMHQQHMCLILLKVEQSAFTQASF